MAIEDSPAFLGSSGCDCPGLKFYFVVKAAALPKITKSKRELAPNLLAPWTDATADSPAAIRPGIITYLPLTIFVTSVL